MYHNEVFLRAITPLIDGFWTVVWSSVGSTISIPGVAIHGR